MIRSEADLEAALNSLAETDEHFATAKRQVMDCEILCKRVRARVFLTGIGSIAERNAHAEVHKDTDHIDKMLSEAVQTFETLKAQRQTLERNIEIWRSLEASRRRVLA